MTVLVTVAIGRVNTIQGEPSPAADDMDDLAFAASLGERFSVARADHFVLAYHGVERADADRMLRWMESTFDRVRHFGRMYGLPWTPPRGRMQVVCATDPRRLGVAMSRSWSGVFDASSGRAYYDLSRRLSVAGAPRRSHDASVEAERITVQHETAHQVLDHLWPALSANMPAWLSEGLACAFEVSGGVGVQGSRSMNTYRARDVLRMVQRGVDLRALMAEHGHGAGMSSDAPRTSARWYAASWSVVFFLQEERRPSFHALLRALNAPSRSRAAVDHRGTIDRIVGPLDAAVWRDIVTCVRVAFEAAASPKGDQP